MKALGRLRAFEGSEARHLLLPRAQDLRGLSRQLPHEEQDAKTYAAWGIDYLKYDWCSGTRRCIRSSSMPARLTRRWGEALRDSGRPIVYSLCQYGYDRLMDWGAEVGGNAWRTTGDISDAWDVHDADRLRQAAPYQDASGPGHWNDPDMLEIGNGGMTDDEYRTHMSLWALLAAPLLAGNDLRDVHAEYPGDSDEQGSDRDRSGQDGQTSAARLQERRPGSCGRARSSAAALPWACLIAASRQPK